MRNYKDLDEILLSTIRNIVGDDEVVELNTNLAELIDSLDYVEFIMELEKYFDISIDDDDAELLSKKNPTLLDIKKLLKDSHNISDIKAQRKDKLQRINSQK
jgi:acyl carrier protein